MDAKTADSPSVSVAKTEPALRELNRRTAFSTSDFIAEYWPRLAAISAAVLAPCLWHPHIEAGDLASHVYNAWLAQLIRTGQAPGLWIAHQWNNVLFDITLAALGRVVGLAAAEKLATSLAVLLFFWGAFALVCALMRIAGARTVPWFLLPFLAIAAYGWTFEMGFLNFYISLGLAFFALALLAGGRLLPALVLVPFIWLAHPLGLLLLVSLGTYILLAERLPLPYHAALFAACALGLLAVRFYVGHYYDVAWKTGYPIFPDGADQLLLYGRRYALPADLLRVFALACLAVDVARRVASREQKWWLAYLMPLQLYAIVLLATLLLPTAVIVPQFAAPVGFLVERLTSVSAILACGLLGTIQPRKWHLAGFATIAAVFFFYLYQDTATLNRMEDQAQHYVRLLPPGQRVLSTIWPLPGSRLLIGHFVDRACIGQCFGYENYEPPSGQFRIRASAGNPIVLADQADSDAAQEGEYVVKPSDPPLVQIYQCDLTMTNLCMRPLDVGEANGRIGVHRNR